MRKITGYLLMLGLASGLAGCASQTGDNASNDAADTAVDTTPDVALADTYWKLTALADGEIAEPIDNQREAHLVLHREEQRLAGATGCNQLMGHYERDARQITFDQVATTMMACHNGADTQRALLDALARTDSWAVDGKTLTLSDDQDETLARFKAVHLY